MGSPVPGAGQSTARFPSSLRWRSTLPFALTVLVLLAALGAYVSVATRNLDADRLSSRLVAEARLVANELVPLLERSATVGEIDAAVDRQAGLLGARVTVVAAAGDLLAESTPDAGPAEWARSRPEVLAAFRDGAGSAVREDVGVDGRVVYAAALVPGGRAAVVRLAVPLESSDSAVERVRRVATLAVLLAVAAVVAVGVVLGNRIARPIDDLRDGFRAVAAGRLDVVMPSATTRELDELGHAFNGMVRQLRAAREEEARARVRLEATLANLSDGVVVTDSNGELILMNGAAVHLLGLPALPAPGLPFVQVSRDHELAALLRAALAATDDEPKQAEVDHGRSRRVLEVTTRRVAGVNDPLGLVVLRDVTDLRRLERVRREFVANVSHELRTPLTSIKALVETLEAGAIDDQAVAGDFLHRIVGEVDRLAALVDELLNLARLESGRVVLHPEALDPADLLGRASERLRPQTERAGLALEIAVPAGLPAVLADRARLEQVVLNLLHNAIKFTPSGGRITVDAAVANGHVEVAVRDTGVGVPADELPRLFERFYKADKARRSDGTGLGLAITKHIILAHGGTIWAESRPGAGSTFRFTLPLASVDRVGAPAANGDRSGDRARPATRRRAR
ncbi:MAG: cell wall metabolism sensor histidine kinase WalK [Chloroflexota bacterium]|nr:cell wall metabolism sensor histidine kinase WalK [Chloroflexota bacterium]